MYTTFIRGQLGPLDESTMAKVLAMEPTEDEIVEVRWRLEGNDGIEQPLPEPSARVEILLAVVTPSWTAWDREEIEA